MPESFAAPVLLSESWPAYHTIPVPAEVAAVLAASGTRRVVGRLNGLPIRRALVSLGGGTVLIVGRGTLREAGLSAGDTALVDIEPDPEPDRVDLGAEFEAALAADDEAAERFFGFTPGRQRSMATYVTSAKRPETRVRRALELAHKLRTHTLYGDPPRDEPADGPADGPA